MPGPDDHLKSAMERLAEPGDPSGAYERILQKKARHRIVRRMEVVGLVVIVLAGTVGGTFVLAHVFRPGPAVHRPATTVVGNGGIVFAVDQPGAQHLYLVQPDGTGRRQLTSGSWIDVFPTWSPDGARIAFVRATDTGQDIYVMNADGSGLTDLTPTATVKEGDPAWSPDGRHIAFASDQGGSFQIWVMDRDGRHMQRLTDLPGAGANHPAWSPDAKRIAFSVPAGNPGRIYVMNADGTGLHRIHAERRDVPDLLRAGAWSPDGNTILFTRASPLSDPQETSPKLFGISPDGTDIIQLTTGYGADGSWSPDGRFIVLEGADGLYVMRADGTEPKMISVRTSGMGVSWQPVRRAVERSDTPTAVPSTSPSIIPTPTPSPSPAQELPSCATSWVNGGFDGDGQLDTAAVCQSKDGTSKLEVRWATGAAGGVSLPDCQDVCEARGAGDLNGDGRDEFFLVYSAGASTEFVEVFELPASEIFGSHPATIAPPGSPPAFPSGASAQFDLGGSVTHQGFLTCLGAERARRLVSTGIVLSKDQTTWKVHQTTFTFARGKDGLGEFTVVSVDDSSVPVDPSQPFVPAGDSCLDV